MLLYERDKGNTSGFTKKVISETAGDIVTLAEAKNFMRISGTDDDTFISLLLESMIDMAEKYAGITLRSKEYTFEFEEYGTSIPLPYYPHVSVDAVRVKSQGVEDTLTSDDYYVTGQDKLVLNIKQPFQGQQLEVDVTAGYGAADVPPLIKLAILKAALSNYEDRQDNIGGTIVAKMPNDSKTLLDQYRDVII